MKKVRCITKESSAFAMELEELLNKEDAEYYNIIPVATATSGEFSAIVILDYGEEEADKEGENEEKEKLEDLDELIG